MIPPQDITKGLDMGFGSYIGTDVIFTEGSREHNEYFPQLEITGSGARGEGPYTKMIITSVCAEDIYKLARNLTIIACKLEEAEKEIEAATN